MHKCDDLNVSMSGLMVAGVYVIRIVHLRNTVQLIKLFNLIVDVPGIRAFCNLHSVVLDCSKIVVRMYVCM